MFKRIKILFHIVLAIFLFSAVVSHAATGAAGYFESGLQSFRAGDYRQALTWFRQAKNSGLDTVALHYNLGASYYKLGHYKAAQDAFKRVARHSPMAPLANYNLGLVAIKLGNKAEAQQWLRQAQATARDVKLKTLATYQLEQLRPATAWFFNANLATGYDDNLIDPGLDVVSTESDNFIELLASLSGPLTGTHQNGLRLDLSIYQLNYQEFDNYDMAVGRIGITKAQPFQLWQTEIGAQSEQSTLGDNDYQRATHLVVVGKRPLTDTLSLKLRYRMSDFTSLEDMYVPLEGSRHQTNLEGRWRTEGGGLRMNYGFESNDREDLANGAVFTSYSPTRHQLRLIAVLPLPANWEIGAELAYRNSVYNDANILASGSVVTRKDDRNHAKLQLSHELSRHWQLNGEYSYTDNQSNIDSYSYKRNLYTLGLSGIF